MYSRLTFKHLCRFPSVAFSTQAAFFVIISAFPMIMLLLSLLHFFPIDIDYVRNAVMDYTPDALHNFLDRILNELFNRSTGTLVSVTAVTSIWASSAGMMALIRGLNAAYDTKDNRNYFWVRSLAVLYTLGFILMVGITLVLLVFGNSILNIVVGYLPAFNYAAYLIRVLRYIVMFVLLTLFFALSFTVLPKEKLKFRHQLPGAVLAAVGWMGFSFGYSQYIQFVSHSSSPVYGSLSAAVFIMLWLYFCMAILFVGASFNKVLKDCRKAKLMCENNIKEGDINEISG